MSRIILASASPRRRELLSQIGLSFEIVPSHKDEVFEKQKPGAVVEVLAAMKAEDIYDTLEEKDDVLVIGADTVVAVDDLILGKPSDEAEAVRMMMKLQGRTHQVYTGVCIKTSKCQICFYEKTDVTMYPVSEAEAVAYAASKEPMDKAGSYAIQGLGAVFIKEISGDYNNVVGLPVASIWQKLMSDESLKKIVAEHCRRMI